MTKKLPPLLALDPDVAVVPESGPPPTMEDGLLWSSPGTRVGLGLVARNGYRLDPFTPDVSIPWSILPYRAHGDVGFNLLAVWTRQESGYVAGLDMALSAYASILSAGPCVIIGDFNANAIWDGPRKRTTFTRVANRLRDEFGLKSAYHEHFAEEYGKETCPTHNFRWNSGTTYHIDYCFVPATWVVEGVKVGGNSTWSKLSDHLPLIVDVSPRGGR